MADLRAGWIGDGSGRVFDDESVVHEGGEPIERRDDTAAAGAELRDCRNQFAVEVRV